MRSILLLAALLAACAPVRPDGDGAWCADDEYAPSDTQEEAADIGDGGTIELVLCPGDEDWLRADVPDFGYIEVSATWLEEGHVGVLELWSQWGRIATTEGQDQTVLWLSSWDGGPHWLHGLLDEAGEREQITLQVAIEEGVVIGR
jgi:hypothetical protein